ncbi:hypothetical protein QA648_35070 (plasmid) [Rhizobium sp. CB3171]|nr:hypothetical protein [Rhizobium sp. CB3171]WFU07130.1 hypothetical protein QA648_35070 [Rhizobium sp. CB3171]
MPGAITQVSDRSLEDSEAALACHPDGYVEGNFRGRRWGSTVTVADGRRIWLFAEELGGRDIVSLNIYRLSGRPTLKPCEMSSSKVIDFLLGFRPDGRMQEGM